MKTENPFTATIVFTILTFLQPALNIFLLPIYLQYFPAEEYAILHLMNNITVLVMTLGTLRINSSLLTHYFDYKYSPRRLKDYLGNMLKVSFLMGGLFFMSALLIGPYFFDLIFKSSSISFYPYGIIAVGIGVFWNFISPYFIFLKNEKEVYKYALLYVLLIIGNIALNLLFIVGMETGIVGALWARLLINGLLFFIVLWLNRELLWRPWYKYYIIRAFQFSLPLLPFLLINWLQVYGDRFILEKYLSLEKVGVYSLLITVVGLLPTAVDAVVNGIRPFLYDYLTEGIEKYVKPTAQLMQLYFGFSLLVFSGIILLGSNIDLFTENETYYEIIVYLPLMTIVFFVRAYAAFMYLLLLFQKKTKLISQLSIVLVFVLLIAYVILIPMFEIWGAIWASFIGNIFILIALIYFTKDQLKIPLPWNHILWMPLIVVAMIVLLNLFVRHGHLSSAIMGIIQFIFVIITVVLFNRKDALRFLKNH